MDYFIGSCTIYFHLPNKKESFVINHLGNEYKMQVSYFLLEIQRINVKIYTAMKKNSD